MSTPAVLTLTESCPDCGGPPLLVERFEKYTVVCGKCRTFTYPEVASIVLAVEAWNANALNSDEARVPWPKWLALLPGEDQANTRREQAETVARDPDMTLYEPYVHVKPIEIDNSKTAPLPARHESNK